MGKFLVVAIFPNFFNKASEHDIANLGVITAPINGFCSTNNNS